MRTGELELAVTFREDDGFSAVAVDETGCEIERYGPWSVASLESMESSRDRKDWPAQLKRLLRARAHSLQSRGYTRVCVVFSSDAHKKLNPRSVPGIKRKREWK